MHVKKTHKHKDSHEHNVIYVAMSTSYLIFKL